MKQSIKNWISLAFCSTLVVVTIGNATAQSPAPDRGGKPEQQTNDESSVAPEMPSDTAGVGARLTYQGRLTNANGSPVTTSVNMTFRLYDDANTAIYTATRTLTPINGLFTVDLGGNGDPDLLLPYPGPIRRIASIGVTVGSDPEMSPRQPFNTVLGHSINSVGVVGSSVNQIGVYGHSTNDIGIYARSSSPTAPALAVDSAGGSSIALRLAFGGIQVFQAGVNTQTPVFIHKAVSGAGGTICSARSYWTVIDHLLTNNNPNAILIVTPNYGNASNGVVPTRGTLGVLYLDNDTCGAGSKNKWVIYNTDMLRTASDPLGSTDIPNNSLFNVMVIVP